MIILLKHKKKHQKSFIAFLCIVLIPTFLLFTVFNILPTIDVFRMSLYSWTGLGGEKIFKGFENFTNMFALSNKIFWTSFGNTVYLMVMSTVLTIVFSLVFAFILSKTKILGKNIFRVIFYIPNILSIVVIAAMFNNIYDFNNGLLNSVLELLNLSHLKQMWLTDSNTVVNSILFIMVWQAIGYYMIMYMAGMDSIDECIYESANIDGANGMIKFFKITLPLTFDVIKVTLTLFITGSMNLSFLLVKAMTDGAPMGSSNVLLNNMYFEAYTNSNFGYGMAIGSFMFVFSFVLSIIISFLTKSREKDAKGGI